MLSQFLLESYDEFHPGYLMVRRQGRWGKLCMDNIDDLLAQHESLGVEHLPSSVQSYEDEDDHFNRAEPWTVNHIGESVCKTLSYR